MPEIRRNSRKKPAQPSTVERYAAIGEAMAGKYSADVPAVARQLGLQEIEVDRGVLALERAGQLAFSTEMRSPSSIHIRRAGDPVPRGRTPTKGWWR